MTRHQTAILDPKVRNDSSRWLPEHRQRLAVRCLRQGGVLAYPTEAVYGLGCDPWSGRAVAPP